MLKAQLEAKAKGFSDVVYLDALEKKYIEEVSSCNIFLVKVILHLPSEGMICSGFLAFHFSYAPKHSPEDLVTMAASFLSISFFLRYSWFFVLITLTSGLDS